MSKDGLVYVCDRGHNRIQVFQKNGTFVREFRVLPESVPGSTGSVMFWPDTQQTYMIVSDDPNGEFHILRRSDGVRVGSAGRVGHFPGEFDNLHNLGIDSKGNIYTAEVQGKRIQRFRATGGL
jgi:sugar lactone lactonase YvrE